MPVEPAPIRRDLHPPLRRGMIGQRVKNDRPDVSSMKLTRRKRIALIAVALFVVGTSCFLFWAASLPTIATDARKIYVGMPYEDVLAIWGTPVQIFTDDGDGWEQAYWDASDGRLIVNFRYGKVTHIAAHEMEPAQFFWWRLRRKLGI
jgi:hypothetical protein